MTGNLIQPDKKVSLGAIIVFTMCAFVACNSGKKDDHPLSHAQWIGAGGGQDQVDTDLYRKDPAPLFRREFKTGKGVTSARLTITAAGYYRASLNGTRVGKNYLDPAWTNYAKRIYYSEYDLTGEIKEGLNCLGVTLGNGFYNSLPLRMWGHLNLREHLPTGDPVFIACLRLEYEGGRTEEIVTDGDWRWTGGPLLRNNVYLGEFYDETKEIIDWDMPGFNDEGWNLPGEGNEPGGVLEKSFSPPVQATGTISPVSVTALDDNTFIADMGVNFAGIYRLRLDGNEGDTITLRFGERLYDDGRLNPMTTVAGQIKRAGTGGPGAPQVAWQADTIVLGEREGSRWYTPEFTFHTYRYIEISGLEYTPGTSDIEGIVLNSNVPSAGEFSTSSELVNSIYDASRRTFLANLISVQSDCPAREKFGYGGDLNATSEAFIYNFNMREFYRKTIYDWLDAINDSVFVDTAPYVGIRYCGLSWESAFLTTQYYLYLYYNDTAIVRELYQHDLEWMEKAGRLHPGGLVEEGLSDHESLEPVPVELTGTGHYLQCARIMEQFAVLMGDTASRKRFGELSAGLAAAIKERFWDNHYRGPINRQTLFSTLLFHGVLSGEDAAAAGDSLLRSLHSAPGGHITTGIFGTKYILEALSAAGHADDLFRVVDNTGYPGWGYMISRGATTIWETWKESDNTFSNCHPMFGSVTEWFYRWLGGIRPDPDFPGFERFTLNPALPEGLSFVKCSYSSPYGKIVSNWRRDSSGRVRFEMSVPEGSSAMVRMPSPGQGKFTIDGLPARLRFAPPVYKDNCYNFELPAGEYRILLEPGTTGN